MAQASGTVTPRNAGRFAFAMFVAFMAPFVAHVAAFLVPILGGRGWVTLGVVAFAWTVLAVVVPTGPTKSSRDGAIAGLVLGSAAVYLLILWAFA